MLASYFKRIYVINLASRADRRREMGAALQRVGMSFDDEAVTLFPAVRPDEAGPFPSIGARGCFMSHLGILQDAAARGDGPIAILEDDLEFSADFADRAPALLDSLLAMNWSVFYGGYEAHSFDETGLVKVMPDAPLRTTHFICFNSETIPIAQKYLEAILARPAGDPAGGPMHVDGAYCWLRKDHPELMTFAASPPLGDQRSSRSDIAPLRWYDRSPVLSPVAAFLRKTLRRN